MSARSRDLISATLISAGIVGAGEIHLAAGGQSTSAFQTYWNDWFDNDYFHTSTNDISVGEAALSSGRNDVLLVGPGTHDVSTALTWSKGDTHLVGAGQIGSARPSPIIQPHGAVATLIAADSTGISFAGITFRNGQSTGSTTCIQTIHTSTNSIGFTMRNCFVWGPEDDGVNDSTGGWNLVFIEGGDNYFENCYFGYGWPISGTPSAPSLEPCFVKFQKSVFNASHWKNCVFQAEFKHAEHCCMLFNYAMANGVYHTFKNTQFINVGSTACALGIRSDAGGQAIGTTKNVLFFDSDCVFIGVTDVSAATNERFVKFPGGSYGTSDNTGGTYTGLGIGFDHTSG